MSAPAGDGWGADCQLGICLTLKNRGNYESIYLLRCRIVAVVRMYWD